MTSHGPGRALFARTARPAADVAIDAAGVGRLLDTQCPDLARGPVRLVGEGWDNFTFRVGDRHAVRLPRRESAVALLRNEQRWLPELAPRLPLAVPEPVHGGTPDDSFPWPWSVVAWVEGRTAEPFDVGPGGADALAGALRALHGIAPVEAPRNRFRGVPLAATGEALEARLSRLGQHPGVDAGRLAAIWRDGCAAPHASQRRWVHGDLHPRNVIVRDGALAGLIDWGDLSGGDVATDLAAAWLLIGDAAVRRRFLEAYAPTEAELARARGWAVHLGLALADAAEPDCAPLGLAALDRVCGG